MNGVVRSGLGARRGFTLVEMVLALFVTTLLLGAMGSAVVIASRALPDVDTLSRRVAAGEAALDAIERDLGAAATFTEAGTRAAGVTVPDRGLGADGDEVVRFAWSGTPGDPVTISVNGFTPESVLCENVHAFSVAYSEVSVERTTPPRVMLIVDDADGLVATLGGLLDDVLSGLLGGGSEDTVDNDVLRVSLLSRWEFPVEIYDYNDDTATLNAGIADADVVYLSDSGFLGLEDVAVLDSAKGIVSESPISTFPMGVATNNLQWAGDAITIVDTDHPVTAGLSMGAHGVTDSTQALCYLVSEAPGAQVLAQAGSYASLVAIERDGQLVGGDESPGRRVKLAWGWAPTFDYAELTPNAHLLIKRALVWASATWHYQTVTVTIQVGDDPGSAVTREIRMLNLPEVLP